jgi:DnaD/phage-associated family protein
LLEEMDDIAELKCTLRVVRLLHQRRGDSRYVTEGELLSDPALLAGLRDLEPSAPQAIRRGMRRGVERKTFLSLPVESGGERQEVYFLNDEAGRRALEKARQGNTKLRAAVAEEGAPVEPPPPKASIFSLYEENIGMLTPLLADELKEAERDYPWPWIEAAFRLAVSRNARSWRYIEVTLRRWAAEGKDDGEPGRHTEKTPTAEGLAEYLRERGRLRDS